MKKIIAGILMVLMLLPVTAFAEGGHTLGYLDLVSEDHSEKTLEADGYTWDAEKCELTIRDLTVTDSVQLPKKDCTIYVQGTCRLGGLTRDDSGAAQSLTINGEDGAKLAATIDVAGALTLNHLTMTEGEIRNASVGLNYALTMTDSDITIQGLSWMTDAGIELKNSKLYVQVPMDELGQCWTEMIAMDNKSEIESDRPLSNYGRRDLADFGDVLNYVAEPEGGRFYQEPGESEMLRAITIVTEVDGGELMPVDHFILKAPQTPGTEPGEGEKPEEGKPEEGKPGDAPATGDEGVVLYAACGLLAAGAVSALVLHRKKEN